MLRPLRRVWDVGAVSDGVVRVAELRAMFDLLIGHLEEVVGDAVELDDDSLTHRANVSHPARPSRPPGRSAQARRPRRSALWTSGPPGRGAGRGSGVRTG